jgi:hypothetical protein
MIKNFLKDLDASDVLYGLGVLAVGIGAGGFDWRVGLLLAGAVLLYTVLVPTHRAPKDGN